MLKCQEVTHLIASDDYQDMGFMQRLEMRMHLLMCRHCLSYMKQMRAIGKGARQLVGGREPTNEELDQLEKEICTRICHQDGSGSH